MARINLSQHIHENIHDEVMGVSGPAAMTMAPANSKKAVNDGYFTHQSIDEVNTIKKYFKKKLWNFCPQLFDFVMSLRSLRGDNLATKLT